ncbi:hypothetical protein [uncultured Eubacterium sp.]|uniref:hypothetical protein n=1 Tax=uncultured Eubacterium sp. TaxID=165185 RepID=UPI0025CDBCF2|nr:hypothetical protein [uncultured Eubacterium sp.]
MKSKENQKKFKIILLSAVILIIALVGVLAVQISKNSNDTKEPKYITVADIKVINNNKVDTSAILDVIQKNNKDFDKGSVKTVCHQTTDQNDYTIDIIEMYGDIETSSCYTAFVENGVLTRIADNHYPDFESDKKLNAGKKLSKKDTEKILKKQREKAKKIGAVRVSNQEYRYYYDCEKKALKLIVLTDYIADDETTNVLEYEKEL